jgi:hypothetical protein
MMRFMVRIQPGGEMPYYIDQDGHKYGSVYDLKRPFKTFDAAHDVVEKHRARQVVVQEVAEVLPHPSYERDTSLDFFLGGFAAGIISALTVIFLIGYLT